MAKTVLQIVSQAYRATLEEQDDTILWLTHAMKGQGAGITVLLTGTAVNYGVSTQDASGLTIGAWHQKNPPNIAGDVASLRDKGVTVYYIKEDAAELGLERADLISGLSPLGRNGVAEVMASHDLVFHW